MSGGTNYDRHNSLVKGIQDIIQHTVSATEAVTAVTEQCVSGMKLHAQAEDMAGSAFAMAHDLAGVTSIFAECFGDLMKLGEAIKPVMESSPESAPALMANVYSAFLRQLATYYKEAESVVRRNSVVFEKGRTAFLHDAYNSNGLTTPGVGTPHNCSGLESYDRTSGAISVEEMPVAENPRLSTDKNTHNGATFVGSASTSRSEAPLCESEKPLALNDNCDVQLMGFLDSHVLSTTDSDAEMLALAEAAAVGAGLSCSRIHTGRLSFLSDSDPKVPEAGGSSVSEPLCVTVTSTVENALGSAVLASRPDVFTEMAKLMSGEPVASYYIRLVPPSNLRSFVVRNYINADECTQADLLCSVLGTDCAEVESFNSVSGEVVVHDDADLAKLPVCAWRLGSSEDHSRQLYTMYAFIKPQSSGRPSVAIHDSLIMDGKRAEVLHIISMVLGASHFAKVSIYTLPAEPVSRAISTEVGGAGSIVSFTCSSFAHAGYTEASEEEVLSGLLRRQSDSTVEREAPEEQMHVAEALQPSAAQLAELSSQGNSSGFRLGDAAKVAVRGSIQVLKARLTAGVAAGNAMLDASGVSMPSWGTIDSTFHRVFPELEAEELANGFTCTWENGAASQQGFLCVTRQWLCFACSTTTAKFSMEYDEIKDVQKVKSSSMVDNAIEVVSHLNDHYVLANMPQRDQAYSLVMRHWVT